MTRAYRHEISFWVLCRQALEEAASLSANHSATALYKCHKKYTLDPKTREIPNETKKQAVKMYLTGISARKVGQIYGFSKANVLNWIKKNDENPCTHGYHYCPLRSHSRVRFPTKGFLLL